MRAEQARGGTNRPGVPESVFAMPPGLRMRYDLPAGTLADCVTGYAIYICDDRVPMVNWYLPAPGMIVVLLDAGPMAVRFRRREVPDLPQASAWGPTTHAYRTVTHGGISVGIGLSAEGWSRLTRQSARQWRDQITPLSTVVEPAEVASLIAALESLDDDAAIAPILDRLLPPLFRDPTPADARLRSLGRALNDPGLGGIDDLAASLELTPSALRLLSTNGLGMPVKTALTRARFIRSYVAWLGTGRPAKFKGLGDSYYDQAHFLRDARIFLGSTPRRLDDLETVFLRTSILARAAVIGTGAHVLHEPT